MFKRITIFIFVLVLVSACSPAAIQDSSEAVNACALISASEFEKLVAVKTEASKGENNECIYNSLDSRTTQFFLFVTKFNSEEVTVQKLTERIDAFKGVGKLPFSVDKLADGASFFCEGVLESCTLLARTNTHLIEITSIGLKEEIAIAAHKQLATYLLTKI